MPPSERTALEVELASLRDLLEDAEASLHLLRGREPGKGGRGPGGYFNSLPLSYLLLLLGVCLFGLYRLFQIEHEKY